MAAMHDDASELAAAIESEAAAAAEAVRARRRVDLLIARVDQTRTAAAEPLATPLLSRAQLGRALATSVATIDRDTRVGMPCVLVGDRRRYDLAEVRGWLASHPKGARRRFHEAASDPIDVSQLARAAGLRSVAGGQ